jgi:hypothetical protein
MDLSQRPPVDAPHLYVRTAEIDTDAHVYLGSMKEVMGDYKPECVDFRPTKAIL